MASTGPTASEQHAEAKKPRIPCKCKEDMFTSHGTGKPVNGISVYQFCSRPRSYRQRSHSLSTHGRQVRCRTW
jgi:hypothetical protein